MKNQGYIIDQYNRFQKQNNEVEVFKYGGEMWCIRLVDLDDSGSPQLPISWDDAPLRPHYYKVWNSIAAIHAYID
jgi:hypothetical protein